MIKFSNKVPRGHDMKPVPKGANARATQPYSGYGVDGCSDKGGGNYGTKGVGGGSKGNYGTGL